MRLSTNKTSIEHTRKEAVEKVYAMANRTEVAYYGEDDSIATIKNGVELISAIDYSMADSNIRSRAKANSIASIITNNSQLDDKSVASSITWEIMISKQSQTDAKLDKIDSTLDKILQFI